MTTKLKNFTKNLVKIFLYWPLRCDQKYKILQNFHRIKFLNFKIFCSFSSFLSTIKNILVSWLQKSIRTLFKTSPRLISLTVKSLKSPILPPASGDLPNKHKSLQPRKLSTSIGPEPLLLKLSSQIKLWRKLSFQFQKCVLTSLLQLNTQYRLLEILFGTSKLFIYLSKYFIHKKIQ